MICWSGEDQRDDDVQPEDDPLVIARRTWAIRTAGECVVVNGLVYVE
jgi:hypothetical protein